MDFVEAGKIEITAIHDIDGPHLDDQLVDDIDIVDLPCGYDDHRGNVAAQVQQGMEFYCPLPFSELGPGKQSQAEVYGGRIQGVDHLIQFDAEGIGGIKASGFCDQDLSKIGIDLPISGLIGVGQGIAGDLAPDAQVIKSGLGCPQAGLDIPQAFPVGELGEGHAEILVPAGKTYHLVVAVEPIDALSELVCGDKIHQLSKDRFPGIHALSPFALMQETCISEKLISNR